MNEEFKKALKGLANDNRVTCHQLRELAKEMNVSYSDSGKTANELKIKIVECELGCF
ncbi:MAG: hypothetical protein AB1488_07015 [Nitrospirota bacterium]